MGPIEVLAIIAVVWIAPIVVATKLGDTKRRKGWWYGILLGWLGVLILALQPARPPLETPAFRGDRRADQPLKKCPDCAELVQPDARVCKHCGYRFAPEPATTS